MSPPTQVELANLLGVTRVTLNKWAKMDGAPKPLSNGQLPVADWREFVRQRGLKGGEPVTANAEGLKARKLLAEVCPPVSQTRDSACVML